LKFSENGADTRDRLAVDHVVGGAAVVARTVVHNIVMFSVVVVSSITAVRVERLPRVEGACLDDGGVVMDLVDDDDVRLRVAIVMVMLLHDHLGGLLVVVVFFYHHLGLRFRLRLRLIFRLWLTGRLLVALLPTEILTTAVRHLVL